MSISLSPLPFAEDALEPIISTQTMDVHYGKHHKGYVDKLNNQIRGTELEQASLPEIARSAWRSGNQGIFNNAAQAWNHEFFWSSLSPRASTPGSEIQTLIDRDFGSSAELLKLLADAAITQFGSGWAWLVAEEDRLKVVTTSNADSPLVHTGQVPLLTIDVWEHAYYLDYQNDRKRYVDAVVTKLLNWDAASDRLRSSETAADSPTEVSAG